MKIFKTLRKRGLALFLVLTMCLSMLPATALADDEAESTGTVIEDVAETEPAGGPADAPEEIPQEPGEESGEVTEIPGGDDAQEPAETPEEPSEEVDGDSATPEADGAEMPVLEDEVPAEVQAFLDAVAAIPAITLDNAAEVAEYVYGPVSEAYDALLGTEYEDRADVLAAVTRYAAAIDAVDAALDIAGGTFEATGDSLFSRTYHIYDQNFVEELEYGRPNLRVSVGLGETWTDQGEMLINDKGYDIYKVTSWDSVSVWSTNEKVLKVTHEISGSTLKIKYEGISDGTASVRIAFNATTSSQGQGIYGPAGMSGAAAVSGCTFATVTVGTGGSGGSGGESGNKPATYNKFHYVNLPVGATMDFLELYLYDGRQIGNVTKVSNYSSDATVAVITGNRAWSSEYYAYTVTPEITGVGPGDAEVYCTYSNFDGTESMVEKFTVHVYEPETVTISEKTNLMFQYDGAAPNGDPSATDTKVVSAEWIDYGDADYWDLRGIEVTPENSGTTRVSGWHYSTQEVGGRNGYDSFTISCDEWIVRVEDTNATYTVTYTDGVLGENVFYDQGYEGLHVGDSTPAFEGTPSREGHTFKGWKLTTSIPEKNGVQAKVVAADANVNNEIIYVAQWDEDTSKTIPYTIVYKALPADEKEVTNLPESETKQGTAPGAVEFTLSKQVPVREGYTFAGWDGDVGYKFGGEKVIVKAETANTTKVTKTMYATWTKNKPTPQEVRDGIGTAVTVYCDTENKSSNSFGYTGKNADRISIGEVQGNATKGYTCKVTFLAQKFCDAYNDLGSVTKTHKLAEGQGNEVVTFTWNTNEKKWETTTKSVTIHVVCEPTDPAPKLAVTKTMTELENGNVRFDVTVENKGDTLYNLMLVDTMDKTLKAVSDMDAVQVDVTGNGKNTEVGFMGVWEDAKAPVRDAKNCIVWTTDGGVTRNENGEDKWDFTWMLGGEFKTGAKVTLTYAAEIIFPDDADSVTYYNYADAIAGTEEADMPKYEGPNAISTFSFVSGGSGPVGSGGSSGGGTTGGSGPVGGTKYRYTLTYDFNGGEQGGQPSVKVTKWDSESYYTFTVDGDVVPVRTGYTLNTATWPWANSTESTSANAFYKAGSEIIATQGDGQHKTIYAQWTPDPAKIVFEENGGTEVDDMTGVTDEVISNRTMPTTTKDGFDFGGWYDNEELTGTAVTALPEKFPAGTTTYYAKWVEKAPTIDDLTITKTVSGTETEINVGKSVMYTIRVENSAGKDAVVTVTDTLPAGLKYQRASSPVQSSTGYVNVSATENNGTVTWSNVTIPAKGWIDLTVIATVLQHGTIQNTATVTLGEQSKPSDPATVTGKGKITGFSKDVLYGGDDAQLAAVKAAISNFDSLGVTVPASKNNKLFAEVKLSDFANDQIKLLFVLHVSGNPGTPYAVEDTGAERVGGAEMTGNLPLQTDANGKAHAYIYVTRTFAKSEISNGYLNNAATVTPGMNGQTTTTAEDSVAVKMPTVTVRYMCDESKTSFTSNVTHSYTLAEGETYDHSVDPNVTTYPTADGFNSKVKSPKTFTIEGGSTWAFDEVLTTNALTGTMGDEDIVIDVWYSKDMKGTVGTDPETGNPTDTSDGTPDKYQAKVVYTAGAGGTQTGVDAYATIMKDGKMSTEGTISINGAAAQPSEDHHFTKWTAAAAGHDGWSYEDSTEATLAAGSIEAKGGAVYTFTANFEADPTTPLDVKADDVVDTYDGETHPVVPTTNKEGATVIVTYTDKDGNEISGEPKDAGEYTATITATLGKESKTITAKVTINKRTLTVITDSDSKVYDGTALTAPGRIDGLVDGETVTFTVTGSQTDVGSSSNTYSLIWGGTAKESNYTVSESSIGTLTVTRATVYHTLIIHYVYAGGGTAALDYTATLAEGAGYSVASPAIAGYTVDRTVVSGTMGDTDLVFTVTYTPIPPAQHNLTIHYVYAGGGTAAADYTATLAEGAAYSVASPAIAGYTADVIVVAGIIGDTDAEYTVVYTAIPTTGPVTPVTPVTPNPGTPNIPDAPAPLGPTPGTNIGDEDVPLAGAVGLNDVDHFAYIIGYDDDTVRPLNNITRAEVATIFFRLMTDEYRNANWATENEFSDVSAGNWFNNAISTCANAGALNGYADGSFKPNASITRAEFAAIAARFLDKEEYTDDGTGDFSDTADHWAAKEIRLAAKAGWITGSNNQFRPDDLITRAEVMTIVNRMLDRVPDADHMLESMKKWTDNPEGTWYYEAVQEATNEHAYERDELGVTETWTELLTIRDWKALELEWAEANAK